MQRCVNSKTALIAGALQRTPTCSRGVNLHVHVLSVVFCMVYLLYQFMKQSSNICKSRFGAGFRRLVPLTDARTLTRVDFQISMSKCNFRNAFMQVGHDKIVHDVFIFK